MPTPISLPSPLIAGGVSQQPAHLRFPGQVQAATNVDFTVTDGLMKRRGSRFFYKVTGLDSSGTYRLHSINRDDTEQYVVVYGRASSAMVIKAYRVGDTSAFGASTVTISSDAQTYLNSGSATADQLRLVTIADYTIITNTTVVTACGTSTNYTVAGSAKNYRQLISKQPTNATYWRTEEDDDLRPAGYFYYVATDSDSPPAATVFASWTGPTLSGSSWHTVAKYQSSGDDQGGFRMFFQRVSATQVNCTYTAATRRITKVGAFTGYTWATGDQVYITAGTGHTVGYYTISSKIDNDTIALSSASGLSGADNANTGITGIGRGANATANFKGRALSTMDDVAQVFEEAIRDAGVTDALCAWEWVTNTTGRFVVTSPYGTSAATVTTPLAPLSGSTYTGGGEPFEAGTGTPAAGSGGSVGTLTPLSDRWIPVAAPNQPQATITASTMPIKMSRTSAGTVGASASVFNVALNTWTDRLSGDEDSNPAPELITTGQRIADVVLLRDRLWFGGGEHIQSSRSGDYFNLFAEDHDNALDSDPIARQLSTEEVTLIDSLVPIGRALAIFTKAGRQFELTADEAMTNATAVTSPSTSHPALSITPTVMHNLIYFAGSSGSYAQLLEYRHAEAFAQSSAGNVSAHVPEYLPASIRTIAANQNNNIVAVLPSSGTTLYVYRAFWNGDRKEQSAWTAWTFDASYRLCDICVVKNDLYILVESQSAYYLERIPLAPEAADSGFPFTVHLDRKQTHNTGTFGGANTTWTLAGSLSDTTINTAVANTGTVYTVTCSGTTVTAAGVNLAATPVILGRSFSVSVEPTQPYLRDRQGNVQTEPGLHVQKLVVTHKNSGTYSIRSNYSQNIADNVTTTTITSGTLSARDTTVAWIMARADLVTVTIESSDPRPLNIPTIEHMAWPDRTPR